MKTPMLCILAAASAGALAQTPSLDFSGAFLRDMVRKREASYYRIAFRGNVLAEKKDDKTIKLAQHLNTVSSENKSGKGRDLTLRYENGSLASGGLADAFGITDLNLRGLDFLRGTANVGFGADGRNMSYAVGLETPHFTTRQDFANWLAVGIQALRLEDTNTSNDSNNGIATFRAYVGKAGYTRGSEADVAKYIASKEVARELDALVNAAPTLDAVKLVHAGFKDTPESEWSYTQHLIKEIFDADDSSKPIRELGEMIVASDVANDLRKPLWSVSIEGTGWYAFASKNLVGDRFKALFTATLDYWPFKDRDDFYLRIRYENGFERAAPNERKGQIILGAGIKF